MEKHLADCIIRIADFIAAAILIIILFPIMILVSIMIFVFIGPSLLYVTRRVGRFGIEYNHYKFTSMLPGDEKGRIFFEQDRLNRCGKLLRALHLDELPELFLILFGMMSFVGPRPLPRRLTVGLDTSIREKVRPGWTGPAQLRLLKHGSLDKHHQVELDNLYVERRSFPYNLQIIAQTIFYSFHHGKPDMSPESTSDRVEFGKGA